VFTQSYLALNFFKNSAFDSIPSKKGFQKAICNKDERTGANRKVHGGPARTKAQ
jgi:hypothetical protein